MKLPGLIDVHVHLREPGAVYKEDIESGTKAALAGGITTVLAMPNTQPPVVDGQVLSHVESAARSACCDVGFYMGGSIDNAKRIADVAERSVGLKLYLDATYGPLRLGGMSTWAAHLKHWPRTRPIAAHAEGKTLAALLYLSHIHDRHVHICHVATREEITLIKWAKESGMRVTCEVAPHHLFLSTEDISHLGPGKSEVRPRLATPDDRQALWDNLEVIDCFATDHAPHTLEEKEGDDPPPGFPGLETALPLFLNAVHEGRLTMEDVVARMYTRPREIFGIPEQKETWITIDPGRPYEIKASDHASKCGWTPFEGWTGKGCVTQVVLRGNQVYGEGEWSTTPGTGVNVADLMEV